MLFLGKNHPGDLSSPLKHCPVTSTPCKVLQSTPAPGRGASEAVSVSRFASAVAGGRAGGSGGTCAAHLA